jgi:hypothetical protein
MPAMLDPIRVQRGCQNTGGPASGSYNHRDYPPAKSHGSIGTYLILCLLQVERIASDKRIELKTKFSFIFLMYIYNFVTSIV